MLTLLRNIMVWNAVIEQLKGLAQAVQIGSTPSVIWSYQQINTPITLIQPISFVQNGFAELFFYPDSAKNTINVDCISVDVSGNLTVGSKRILSGIDSYLFNAAAIPRSPTNFALITSTKFDYPNSGGVGVNVSYHVVDNACRILNQTSLTNPQFTVSGLGGSPIIFQNAARQIVSLRDLSASITNCNATSDNSPAITIDVATGTMSQQNTSIPLRFSSITATANGYAFTTPISLLGCNTGNSLVFASSSGAVQTYKPLNDTSRCALTSTQAGLTVTLCTPSSIAQPAVYAVVLSVYNPDHSLNATYTIKSSTKFVGYGTPSVAVSEVNAAIYPIWTETSSSGFAQFHAQPFTLSARPISALSEITFGSQSTQLKFAFVSALDGANVLFTYYEDPNMYAIKVNWPNPAAATTATLQSQPSTSQLPSTANKNSVALAMSTAGIGFLSSASNVSRVGSGTAESLASVHSTSALESTFDVAPSPSHPKENDNLAMIIGIVIGAGLGVSSLIMFVVFYLRHQRKSADNSALAAKPQQIKPPAYSSVDVRFKDEPSALPAVGEANPYIQIPLGPPDSHPHYQNGPPSRNDEDSGSQHLSVEELEHINQAEEARLALHKNYDDVDAILGGGIRPNQ